MKTHRSFIIFALLGALVVATPALAQKRGRGRGDGPGMGRGHGKGHHGKGMRGSVRRELMEYLYPIGLIRHYSTDIKLTDEQVGKLRKVVTDVNGEIERLKWDVEKEAQKLTDLVKNGASKEQVYRQMDVVFKYENKIKKKHLGLMIVARDILTKKQRAHLDKVKEEYKGSRGWRHRGGPPGPPPHGGPNPGF